MLPALEAPRDLVGSDSRPDGEAPAKGVIFAYSGRDTFRLLPALVMPDSQLSQGAAVLDGVLGEAEKGRV